MPVKLVPICGRFKVKGVAQKEEYEGEDSETYGTKGSME
jgi:hypothetical protein